MPLIALLPWISATLSHAGKVDVLIRVIINGGRTFDKAPRFDHRHRSIRPTRTTRHISHRTQMDTSSDSSLANAIDSDSRSSTGELLFSRVARDFQREPIHNQQIKPPPPFDSPFKNQRPAERADADDLLDFIALLNASSKTNEIGWTHERDLRAIIAKRARQESSKNRNKHVGFDFFSHFDPTLRKDLRRAYERRKRFGYTGDPQPGSDNSSLLEQSKRKLADMIDLAIATPARESKGQVARRERMEDTERDNMVMDASDDMFSPTLQDNDNESSEDQEFHDAEEFAEPRTLEDEPED